MKSLDSNSKAQGATGPNVLFVNTPTIPIADIAAAFKNEGLRGQALSMPLGLMYISSYLRKHSHVGTVQLLDYILAMKGISEHADIGSFVTSIAERDVHFDPDIVAFSLNFSASYQFFEECTAILRRRWPKAVTICGGVHATNTARELLLRRDVDYVVRGEAELSFSELVNQLACSQPVHIQGVYSRDDRLPSGPLSLSVHAEDLDMLPFPDWSLIDMDQYTIAPGRRRELGARHRMASLFTTRGCPFHCTFCSAHTVHGHKVRARSVRNIIQEIRWLHEHYQITLFMPEDDLFTANKKRILSVLKAIKDLRIPGLEVQTPDGLSISTLDEELIDALIDAGTHIGTVAIESGSEYVQKHVIRKNCDLGKAREVVRLFQDRDCIVRCYFVLGFPAETKEQMQETIDYARSLGADWCVFMIAMPLVGSEMYDQFLARGDIQDTPELWGNTVFDERRFDTPEIAAQELNDLVYRANLDCNFINNSDMLSGQFAKVLPVFRDIVSHFPFHVVARYCMIQCYRGMGDNDMAIQAEQDLQTLIEHDKRAADMFTKYRELMEHFNL